MKSMKFGLGFLVGCAALMAGGAAFAAEAAVQTTATTTTTTTTPVAEPAAASNPPAPAQPAAMTLPGATPAVATAATDHGSVIGRFGIGYMGRRSIVIDPDPTAGSPASVDAPIIGLRYWLDPMIGIDAGIGLLLSGGSDKTAGVSTDRQGYTVFLLHGGVPLALAGSKHFSFQVIPEMNVGLSSSKRGAAGPDLSGFHFDVGARAGAEVQFGFIGISELSLQAGVGLALSYDRSKASAVGMNPEHSVSETRLGTSVGDNPWNIFTGNIAALYYF